MKKILIALLVVAGSYTTQAQFRIVGYIPNWVNLTTFSNNFDYSMVTHLNIAFKSPNSSGNISAMSSGEANLVTKGHQNGVQVFLSLGGGGAADFTNSSYLSISLNALASKIKQYVVANNLDGIDMDLEGTSIGSNYGSFIQILADSLHPINKKLSVALSQGYGGANVSTTTLTYFDWVNIMAYDACGPTWGTPGQHSTYQLAEDALTYWKGRGVAKANAVLGVPFYGYEFGPSANTNPVSYKYVAANYPDAVYDDQVSSGGGRTIYYNGISTMMDKTSLALTKGGGIMIWDLSLDGTADNSLLAQIRAVAGNAVTANSNATIEDKSFSVFPNPTNGLVNFAGNFSEGAKIELYNIAGQKIQSYQEASFLDMSEEPKGIYYLHIIKEEKTIVRKIIVQ